MHFVSSPGGRSIVARRFNVWERPHPTYRPEDGRVWPRSCVLWTRRINAILHQALKRLATSARPPGRKTNYDADNDTTRLRGQSPG